MLGYSQQHADLRTVRGNFVILQKNGLRVRKCANKYVLNVLTHYRTAFQYGSEQIAWKVCKAIGKLKTFHIILLAKPPNAVVASLSAHISSP